MAYEQDRAALASGHLSHLAEALLLKLGIADRQYLVHHQDLRLEMRRHREREAHQHAAGIAFDGGVDKLLHTREVHDLLELASDLRMAHAQDGAVEIDVLAPSKLGMKASTDLEQTGDAASDGDTPLAWLGDARQDL